MPLDLSRAEEFVSIVSKLKIAEECCADEETVNRHLDRRDTDPFDSDWTATNTILKELLTNIEAESDRARIQELQEKGRKQAYLAVMRQTGSADLAAYASDDVDLIVGFLATGKNDDFVHSLKIAYESNMLPSSAANTTQQIEDLRLRRGAKPQAVQ